MTVEVCVRNWGRPLRSLHGCIRDPARRRICEVVCELRAESEQCQRPPDRFGVSGDADESVEIGNPGSVFGGWAPDLTRWQRGGRKLTDVLVTGLVDAYRITGLRGHLVRGSFLDRSGCPAGQERGELHGFNHIEVGLTERR